MSTTRIEERRRWIEREIRKANQRIVHNAKELREVMDRVLELSQEHANLLLRTVRHCELSFEGERDGRQLPPELRPVAQKDDLQHY